MMRFFAHVRDVVRVLRGKDVSLKSMTAKLDKEVERVSD